MCVSTKEYLRQLDDLEATLRRFSHLDETEQALLLWIPEVRKSAVERLQKAQDRGRACGKSNRKAVVPHHHSVTDEGVTTTIERPNIYTGVGLNDEAGRRLQWSLLFGGTDCEPPDWL